MSQLTDNKMVIIDLEETEKAVTKEDNKLENIQVSGVLSIHNASERCRIWNVRVLLDGSQKNTDIGEDTLSAGEIEAGGEWESPYSVTVSKPILELTETYDTSYDIESEEPHWAYASGKENKIRITIRVKNTTSGQLDNIVLNKTIPQELTDVEIESTTSGEANYDEGTRQVVWKEFIIYPEEDSVLKITAVANIDSVESMNAGELVVSYRGEDQQRSSLKPDMSALTEFLTGIETGESQPNQWECTLECSNESDLMIRLDKAEVYLTPEDGGPKQKMIDEAPSKEMEPGGEWSSSFNIESKSPPVCTQEIIYTPMRKLTRRVLGTVTKTPLTVPVYRVGYMKEFDPPSVSSSDKTPVEVTIQVINNGTAPLNDIIIEDSLPDDVMPPKKEHVSIWIGGRDFTEDYEFTIDPDDQNPESPHQITIALRNLKDTMGQLKPGENVKVNYAIMAWKVRPEKEYPSPISCKANIDPMGHYTEIDSGPEGHKIGVIYKKRSISVKKAINKGASPGEYIIMIVAENKGEVTVENVEVTDWIPAGFQYVSTDPVEEEPSLAPSDDGNDLVWKWTKMNPGDKKKINITVQGEGEYERREPVVKSD